MKKIGFWSVTSLVVGSQIGSGILLLPASLAPFGAIGLASWAITATGALCLALIFARLPSGGTVGTNGLTAAGIRDQREYKPHEIILKERCNG